MKERNIYLNKFLFYSFLLLFCFGFILLFTSSSPYRKDQFVVRIFLQVVIVLMLQLGNPVPLIGLSLWIC